MPAEIFDSLTPRERQIVVEIASGHRIQEIADHLGLTHNTVKSYLKRIYLKAEVNSARGLLVRCFAASGGAVEKDVQLKFLQAVERLLKAPDCEAILKALYDEAEPLIQASTSFWRYGFAKGQEVMVALPSGSTHVIGPSPFLRKLAAAGEAEGSTTPESGTSDEAGPRIAEIGLSGHLYGLSIEVPETEFRKRGLDLPPGPTLMFVSRTSSSFSDVEKYGWRVFARLANERCLRFTAKHHAAAAE